MGKLSPLLKQTTQHWKAVAIGEIIKEGADIEHTPSLTAPPTATLEVRLAIGGLPCLIRV